jgi:hypothetical protein
MTIKPRHPHAQPPRHVDVQAAELDKWLQRLSVKMGALTELAKFVVDRPADIQESRRQYVPCGKPGRMLKFDRS